MGIKQLNSFLKQNCKNSIKTIKFQEVSNKKIAIDISIYLYKFLEEGSIVDNLFMMMQSSNTRMLECWNARP